LFFLTNTLFFSFFFIHPTFLYNIFVFLLMGEFFKILSFLCSSENGKKFLFFCKISERKKTKKEKLRNRENRQKIGIRRAETQQFPLGNRDQVACLGFFNSHDTQFSDPYAIFFARSDRIPSIVRFLTKPRCMREHTPGSSSGDSRGQLSIRFPLFLL